MRPGCVYIFWRDTTPLYVGCTVDLARRMKEHRAYTRYPQESTHITVLEFADIGEALDVERHYIQKLRPANNVHYNPARQRVADRLTFLEYDFEWFSEQPDWLQALTNEWLGITPVQARQRRQEAIRELKRDRALQRFAS